MYHFKVNMSKVNVTGCIRIFGVGAEGILVDHCSTISSWYLRFRCVERGGLLENILFVSTKENGSYIRISPYRYYTVVTVPLSRYYEFHIAVLLGNDIGCF